MIDASPADLVEGVAHTDTQRILMATEKSKLVNGHHDLYEDVINNIDSTTFNPLHEKVSLAGVSFVLTRISCY